MDIEITCPKCKGKGCVRLGRRLMETLANVSIGYDTATAIHTLVGDQVGITAINNRLEDLREMGLLSRQRDGKQWVYSVIENKDYTVIP